jgi:adenosylhomocysteine nucleosidase
MSVSNVAVLAAMNIELKPLIRAFSLQRDGTDRPAVFRGEADGTKLVATTMNMGTAAATKATERILELGPVDHLICIGVAGGLGPSVKVRELVVPEVVVDAATETEYRPAPLPGFTPRGKLWTSDDFETDPVTLSPLIDKGVVALDMETAAIAAVCERRGVPWSVARGLSDHVTDAPVDQAVFGLAQPDGSANVGALVRYIARRPWRVVELARMGRNSLAAAKASVDAVRTALPAL